MTKLRATEAAVKERAVCESVVYKRAAWEIFVCDRAFHG